MEQTAQLSTKALKIWLGITLSLLLATGGILGKQVLRVKKKQKAIHRTFEKLKYAPKFTDNKMGNLPTPLALASLKFAEEDGIIVQTRTIHIPKLAAYNPSLLKTEKGYDLFFRYDVLSNRSRVSPFLTYIGVAGLTEALSLKEQRFKTLDLNTDYAEDPRAFHVGEERFLVYNEPDDDYCGRHLSLANLKKETHEVNYITHLDMNLNNVEKNWAPLTHIDENNDPKIYFEYRIHPRKILKLPDTQANDLQNVLMEKKQAFFPLHWSKWWGEIRGGAPAQKIGDEYVGFFHSSFADESGVHWFTMGAYTFESEPPFRLTGISKHPILFKGIYDTPLTHTAPIDKRVIYPGGFVHVKEEGRDLIHLACGENDCGIKIVTFDLLKLKKSLIRIEN